MQKHSDAVFATTGLVVGGATIVITKSDGTAATLYSDNGNTPISSTLTSDASGEYSFYAANGRYTKTISHPTFTTEVSSDFLLFDPADSPIGLSPEYCGAKGDSTQDDWSAWNVAMAVLTVLGGGRIHMTPGKRYRLSKRLVVPGKVEIQGHPTAAFIAKATDFTNTSLSTKYGDTSCVIDASGLTIAPYTAKQAPRLIGVNVEASGTFAGSGATMGRVVDPIVARNVVDLVIEGCKVTGFGVARGVRVSSITGNSRIVRNEIGSFSDDSNWASSGAQLTGIEVDDDRVNDVASVGIVISDNYIHDITVGATFIASAAAGYQSDGINIKASQSLRHKIVNNTISNTGEGIDNFGCRCAISNNTITDTYGAGIKLIHGAAFNTVSGNVIQRFGRWGIVLEGSNTANVGDIQGNTITGNTVTDGDQSGVWNASGGIACICTTGTGKTYKVKDTLIANNTLNPGSGGQWAFFRGSDGTNIDWIDNKIVAAGLSGRIGNGGGGETGRVLCAFAPKVQAYASATQAVANDGAYHILEVNTVTGAGGSDTLGEHNTGTYITTVKEPGQRMVSASVRFSSVVAGENIELEVRHNGTAVGYNQLAAPSTEVTLKVTPFLLTVAVGDTLAAYVKNGGAASRTASGGDQRFSSLMAVAV